ncbi:hypothetical protein NHONHO_64 [Mycobacterium phage Nhonho]|nr:hypothetical protein NHONHO_64 [Mycobacterium phage Nhonho]AKU45460.1 hypothetical protein NHONHO_64 [Mycobacterium phage Nhonho]UJE15532.1 hypothetical protein SEA_DUSSY_66 [Mycobacterium phage Dussy]UJQ86986.1 membrane protein [Mycobacterium phage Abbyshoes]
MNRIAMTALGGLSLAGALVFGVAAGIARVIAVQDTTEEEVIE